MVNRRGLLGVLCSLPFVGVLKTAEASTTKQKLFHPLLGEIQAVHLCGGNDFGECNLLRPEWVDFPTLDTTYHRYVKFPIEHVIEIIGTKGRAKFTGFNLSAEAKNEIHKHKQELLDHLSDIYSGNGILGVEDHVTICGTKFMLSSYTLEV
jgi:hypothetical protein